MKPEVLLKELNNPIPKSDIDFEDLECIKHALEKQVEKKVKNIRFSRDYELAEHNIMEGECPDCGETVTGSYLGNYCGSCGVALDWEWK